VLDLDQPAASNQVKCDAAEVNKELNAATFENVPGTENLFQENQGSNAELRSQRDFTAVPTRGSQNLLLCCEDRQRWPHLSGVEFTTRPDAIVLLLIGVDAPEAL